LICNILNIGCPGGFNRSDRVWWPG